jgi:death-on-curing protein
VNVEFLRADVLRNVHQRLIETYGGLAGIRDQNALESAIARPKNLAAYTGEASVGALGATLAWALVRSHPFTDGNKRAALAALTTFLEINGYELICTEAEETAMILLAAASEMTEEEFAGWVERSIGKLQG